MEDTIMIKRTKKIFAYSMLGVLLALPMANSADALTNTTTKYYITTNIGTYNTSFQQYFNQIFKNYNTTTIQQPVPTPAPVPQPTPTPAPIAGDFSAYQQEVLNIVNKERASRGLSALKFSTEVSRVATLKSQDMINKGYFDHNSPTYGSPFDMMKQFGITYKSAGENIAMGQRSPQEVMTAWMNSDGHRKNILNSSFTEIGVGIAKDSNGRLYWTQMFIGK
jgi:uncharacterized YkwD family protein